MMTIMTKTFGANHRPDSGPTCAAAACWRPGVDGVSPILKMDFPSKASATCPNMAFCSILGWGRGDPTPSQIGSAVDPPSPPAPLLVSRDIFTSTPDNIKHRASCTDVTTKSQSLNASRPHLGQRLRSTLSTGFSLPQLRTKFGERAFSHSGPAAWNSMPEHIRAEPDIRVSRKLLKTRLF